jgi:hypothetical protein
VPSALNAGIITDTNGLSIYRFNYVVATCFRFATLVAVTGLTSHDSVDTVWGKVSSGKMFTNVPRNSVGLTKLDSMTCLIGCLH